MPHHRIPAAVLAATLSLGLTLGMVAAPAQAETRTIIDKKGDGSNGAGGGGPHKYGDIGAVRVKHGVGLAYFRVFAAEGGQLADFYEIWIDINAADPGPERVIDWSAEVQDADVHRTGAFGVKGPEVDCEIVRQRRIRQGIRVVVRRGCLRRLDGTLPARIRVAVQTSMEYEVADWAPAVRRFGPWIASSAS